MQIVICLKDKKLFKKYKNGGKNMYIDNYGNEYECEEDYLRT